MSAFFKYSAMAVALGASPGVAATLDFSSLPLMTPSPLVLSNATITHGGGGMILVGSVAAGEADGFCFLGSIACEGDGEIAFSFAVSALRFDIDDADPGDSVEITAFLGGASLGSLVFTDNGVADFSAFGAIDRLVFDDSSPAPGGVAYSTFSFEPAILLNARIGVVPLPAAAPLLLGGLAALGLLGRRRRG